MRSVGRDALFSLAALLWSVILVQSLYATVIRPRAEASLAEPAIPQDQLKPGQPVPHNLRSPFVILKDYEHEVALILATWALSLIAYQALAVARNRRLLEKPYIEIGEGHVVLPDDARAYGRPIENLPREEQEMLLPRALLVALNRFGAARSVQGPAAAGPRSPGAGCARGHRPPHHPQHAGELPAPRPQQQRLTPLHLRRCASS